MATTFGYLKYDTSWGIIDPGDHRPYEKHGMTKSGEPGMMSVQIAINKLSRAGLTAYLSERKDPRLIIKYNAKDIQSCRSLVVFEGFISERALNSILLTVAKEARLEVA